MEIISIVNRKGGVGKTTTAHALGAGLMARGYKVLFIDLDNQCNLSYSIGAINPGLTSYEVLTNTSNINESILEINGAYILPASQHLISIEKSLDTPGKEYRLKEALEELNIKFDYAVIDTPANLGTLTVNALTTSNKVIIPVQAEVYSVQGVLMIQEMIEAIQKYFNSRLTVDGLLLTRYSARSILSRQMKESLEEVAESIGSKLYTAKIREAVAVKEAEVMQQDIFTYDAKSNPAKDYNDFIDEFLIDKGV